MDIIDYRKDIIQYPHGGCNACFVVCKYQGTCLKFFVLQKKEVRIVALASNIKNYNSSTLEITSPFDDATLKLLLVPTHLSYYRITQEQLIGLTKTANIIPSDKFTFINY